MRSRSFVLAFAVIFLSLCKPSLAQMPHQPIPNATPAPLIPQPTIPVPSIPTALSFTPPPTVVPVLSAAEKAQQIKDIENQMKVLSEEIYQMNRDFIYSNLSVPHTIVGSLEEAVFQISVNERNIEWYNDQIQRVQDKHDSDPTYYKDDTYVRWLIDGYLQGIAKAQGNIEQWEAEKGVRVSALDKPKADLAAKQKQYDKLAAGLAEIKDDKTKVTKLSVPEPEVLETDPAVVSAADLDPEEPLAGADAGLSAETVDIKRNMTMQELREEDLRRAFSDLGVTENTLTVLETANLAGQITQTVVGYVPGFDVADVSLSFGRGFAESLGDELSKGTCIADALKIAAVNGGVKGTISFIGNKATAGTEAMTNRIAVLTQVGFDKLTTKQVAELGAKGISYLVIKTSQNLTQEVVGVVVDPAVNQVEDALRKGKSSTASGYGSGYGSSFVSQPLAAY